MKKYYLTIWLVLFVLPALACDLLVDREATQRADSRFTTQLAQDATNAFFATQTAIAELTATAEAQTATAEFNLTATGDSLAVQSTATVGPPTEPVFPMILTDDGSRVTYTGPVKSPILVPVESGKSQAFSD